jgi:hypothetical protein
MLASKPLELLPLDSEAVGRTGLERPADGEIVANVYSFDRLDGRRGGKSTRSVVLSD